MKKENLGENQKRTHGARLRKIKKLQNGIVKAETLIKNKERELKNATTEFKLTIHEAFERTIDQPGPLSNFLSKPLPLPHEKYPNCLEVIIDIIANLLIDPLQYGKTVRGGVEQISLTGSQNAASTWTEIESDLKKICIDCFSITPFLDTEKENFPEIGFFMNSKWESPNKSLVE